MECFLRHTRAKHHEKLSTNFHCCSHWLVMFPKMNRLESTTDSALTSKILPLWNDPLFTCPRGFFLLFEQIIKTRGYVPSMGILWHAWLINAVEEVKFTGRRQPRPETWSDTERQKVSTGQAEQRECSSSPKITKTLFLNETILQMSKRYYTCGKNYSFLSPRNFSVWLWFQKHHSCMGIDVTLWGQPLAEWNKPYNAYHGRESTNSNNLTFGENHTRLYGVLQSSTCHNDTSEFNWYRNNWIWSWSNRRIWVVNG